MPPVRRVGAYAKLLANYAADDAIIAAGEQAELLFVRALAFCATSDSDGFVTESQVNRYIGAGMKSLSRRVDALLTHGLWEKADGGYVVRSWTKIHETAEEKGRARRKDRERKASPPEFRAESERNPSGIQKEGSSESLSLIQSSAVTDTGNRNSTVGTSPTPSEMSKAFAEFWAAYPKRVGKDDAARRFAAVVRKNNPTDVIDGARRYATECRGKDPQFIAHPATWLNQGRWADEPVKPTASDQAGGGW